jgi:hypothetical protein
MAWYRVYLYGGSGSFNGRHDFEGADDREAMLVAEHLCEACSDLCETFELWQGVRRVDTSFSRLPHPSVSAEQINLATQNSLIRSEEAMRNSHWAVAQSKRLVERMEHLLARKNGAAMTPEARE